jgi:hypothetical protein
MYPMLIATIMAWFGLVCTMISQENVDLAKEYAKQNRLVDQNKLIAAVENEYKFSGKISLSITDLQAVPGEEHIAFLTPYVDYQVSNTITDSFWTFKRAMVFSQEPLKAMSVDTNTGGYLSNDNNTYNSGTFTTAESWNVKNSRTPWWMLDTRNTHIKNITEAHSRLESTIAKFVTYFNTYGYFPYKKAGNVSMTIGEGNTLASLVNYLGTSSQCDDPYSWDGIPLDSIDLFSVGGKKVVYVYYGPRYVFLEVDSGILDNTGKAIVVSELIDIR